MKSSEQKLYQENELLKQKLINIDEENQNFKNESSKWGQQIRQLETELEETRSVVKKLSDVKYVLNKVITSENLMSGEGGNQ